MWKHGLLNVIEGFQKTVLSISKWYLIDFATSSLSNGLFGYPNIPQPTPLSLPPPKKKITLKCLYFHGPLETIIKPLLLFETSEPCT